jgi:hypothetical protein
MALTNPPPLATVWTAAAGGSRSRLPRSVVHPRARLEVFHTTGSFRRSSTVSARGSALGALLARWLRRESLVNRNPATIVTRGIA